MFDALALYRRFLGISVRAQMEYRVSFLMQAFGNLLVTGGEFLALWALFARFGSIHGWSLAEVALLYGLVDSSYAVSQVLTHGFDVFAGLVKGGEFDRLLLRPRGLVLQVMGQHVALKNIGRLLQGGVIFSWALIQLNVTWSPEKIALIFFAWAGGVCLFFGLMMLQATLAFWTTESLEVMNAMTYGGVETAQFPLSIYPPWLRTFFLAVVPLGCVTYLPVVRVLGRELPFHLPEACGAVAPLASIVFLGWSFWAFMFGVRHYKSVGN